MAVTDKAKKKFVYYFSFLGVAFAIALGGVMEYWRINAPHEPDEAKGIIYPMNFHGGIGYLSQYENILFYVLPGAGLLVLTIVLVVERNKKD